MWTLTITNGFTTRTIETFNREAATIAWIARGWIVTTARHA